MFGGLNSIGQLARDNILIRDQLIEQADKFVQGRILVYDIETELNSYKVGALNIAKDESELHKKDLRFSWEIYRGRFVFNLCLAYIISHDEKYAECLIDHINDWKSFTPLSERDVRYNGMESIIKVINYSWLLTFLPNHLQADPATEKELRQCLLTHINYAYINYDITWYGLESNHALSCSVGLIYASLLFKENSITRRWSEFGKKSLSRCLQSQYSDDGVNFESSTHYHRFTFELLVFLYFVLLESDPEYAKKIEPSVVKIFNSLVGMTHKNNMLSRFGDSDGGEILPSLGSISEFSDMSYLDWFTGLERKTDLKNILFCQREAHRTPFRKSEKIRYGNYCKLQLPSASLISVANKIGTNGKGNHQHNDFTSFEIYGIQPFIIDPWSYCYTGDADLRNLDRSTFSHNLVAIDDEEVVPFSRHQLFQLKGDIDVSAEISNGIICMQHNGYKDLHTGSQVVTRSIHKINGNAFQIVDLVEGHGDHKAEISIYIPKNLWELKQSKSGLKFFNSQEEFFVSFDWESLSISESMYSPMFLNRVPAYKLIFTSHYKKSAQMSLTIHHSC
jgi:hypothetical protein